MIDYKLVITDDTNWLMLVDCTKLKLKTGRLVAFTLTSANCQPLRNNMKAKCYSNKKIRCPAWNVTKPQLRWKLSRPEIEALQGSQVRIVRKHCKRWDVKASLLIGWSGIPTNSPSEHLTMQRYDTSQLTNGDVGTATTVYSISNAKEGHAVLKTRQVKR